MAPEAVYWFSDGSHRDREAVLSAIAETFATIRDEVYRLDDLEWIAHSHDHTVCRYRFTWTGTIDGQLRSGNGRGTNVLVNNAGTWQMFHEHLSAQPGGSIDPQELTVAPRRTAPVGCGQAVGGRARPGAGAGNAAVGYDSDGAGLGGQARGRRLAMAGQRGYPAQYVSPTVANSGALGGVAFSCEVSQDMQPIDRSRV
ncbi:nuclear transport factor 2 family protein [Streptomyces sp. SAI-135]|uniref:nuclear transport factor 2 family protein n=1 Tax=Streptomyces sp. SAI-135 TaxID=2940549 RepID=UPI002473274F|nr:nuclear transport factor 2 family protein [Streptomyces sp. SAI-135]